MAVRRNRGRNRGFMLLVGLTIAIVVAMGIFIANLGVLQIGSYMRVFSTRNTLSRIEDALARYAAVQQRLPCPANPALPSSNAAAGYADGDTTGTLAPATCSFPAGVVPWRTLGLSPADALDPWGRVVSYRVYDGGIGFTQAGGASRVFCDTTNNGVVAETPPTNGLCANDRNTLKDSFTTYKTYGGSKGLVVTDYGTAVNKVAYALISHGPSGLGGYLPTGARMTMPGATAGDYLNTQSAAAGYVKAAFKIIGVDPGAATHYDDVVAYKTLDDLIAVTRLEARDWPELMPKFSPETTANMTSPSTDSLNPHFMSTGSNAAGKLTAFTAQDVLIEGTTNYTTGVFMGQGFAGGSFSACLWWPLPLTLYTALLPLDLRIYTEFAATDNTSDLFAGFTLGFLSGNDPLGPPTNITCGTTDFFTTANGTNGSFDITVADATGIVPGLSVVGAGIGTSGTGTVATVNAVTGTVVTLSRANTVDFTNSVVSFANSRLIRRDLGWEGGTIDSYANRFAVEFDANLDTTTSVTPPVPTANDPTRPHLAIDGSGVVHGSDAESCATQSFGSPCDTPPLSFASVVKTADQVAGQSTIVVTDANGIAIGMPVTGAGIGAGATVVSMLGATISLGTGGTASTPVLNTSTITGNSVTFGVLSSSNFLQNGLSVFHSVRADLSPKACVSKIGTVGAPAANTLTVANASQIAPGMRVYGRNTALGATVISVVGTTVMVSSPNVLAVSERVDFALPLATSKTGSGAAGGSTVTVSDIYGVAVGMSVSGTGIGAGAKVTDVSGTTVTLSAVNSGVVSGTLAFTPPNQQRTATGIAGQNQIDVGDATGIVPAMEVMGSGIGSGATVTGVSGTTLTLSVANSGTVNDIVYVRPSQTLVKSWILSNAGCNADAGTCSSLKDLATAFDKNLSANDQALHAASCIAAPTPADAYSNVYFGFTTSNRSTNVLTTPGSNLVFRQLSVTNLLSQ